MGLVKDVETVIGTVYERYSIENKLIQKVGAVGYIRRSTSGLLYFIITDINGNMIKDANYYLNVSIMNDSYSKRESAFTALKLLYSFFQLQMINDPRSLTGDQIKALGIFLIGGHSIGSIWRYEFQTQREHSTCDGYFGAYRDYYKQVYNIKNNDIFDTRVIGTGYGDGFFAHTKKIEKEKYSTNKGKALDPTKLPPPKYIKPYQYEAIMKIVEQKYSLREEIIIDLMYQYGFRIGEVLGLTFEDVIPMDKENYQVIIRNRVSDRRDQLAKRAYTPKSKSDYDTKEYWRAGIGMGYHIVIVDNRLGMLIDEYIDTSRDQKVLRRSPKKRKNLLDKAVADRVTNIPLSNNQNQYIFLNQQHFAPLTQEGWNSNIRNIFEEAKITTDIGKGKRKDNLSHRFRHGFAMQYAKQGLSQVELAEKMRHSNPQSVMRYYNPDVEDQIEIAKKLDAYKKGRFQF